VSSRLIPCSRNTLRPKAHFLDVLCALVSPWLAVALRDPTLLPLGQSGSILTYAMTGFVATTVVLAFSDVGHVIPEYFSRRDVIGIVKMASVSIVIATFVMFGISRLAFIPRSLPAFHIFVLVTLMVGWRWAQSSLAYRRKIGDAQASKRPTEHVLIIGANRLTWLYSGMMIEALTHGRRKIMAILDENPRLFGRSIHGHRVIGEIRDIEAVVDEYGVHGISIKRVVVAGTKEDISKGSWTHLERVCTARGIALEVLAERLGLLDESSGEGSNSAEPPDCTLTTELAIIRMRPYWRIKRATDIALAILLIAAATPLFLLTSVAVLLDIGRPTVFWQQRVGRDRKPLFVYKFRTLRAPFRHDGKPIAEASRLTHIGRFLRASRLDELPQLFNVLRGDMSIIGPRPLMPADLPDSAELRLSVEPGLTGWAQVHGGNLITPAEKNALDEWYIRNASLWLDIRILVKTLMTVVRGDRRADDVIFRAINASDSQHVSRPSFSKFHFRRRLGLTANPISALWPGRWQP
jgi:lipopolysaccharide/colanic/teichoic acid biosynthesis glycosyltransferase